MLLAQLGREARQGEAGGRQAPIPVSVGLSQPAHPQHPPPSTAEPRRENTGSLTPGTRPSSPLAVAHGPQRGDDGAGRKAGGQSKAPCHGRVPSGLIHPEKEGLGSREDGGALPPGCLLLARCFPSILYRTGMGLFAP